MSAIPDTHYREVLEDAAMEDYGPYIRGSIGDIAPELGHKYGWGFGNGNGKGNGYGNNDGEGYCGILGGDGKGNGQWHGYGQTDGNGYGGGANGETYKFAPGRNYTWTCLEGI